MKAMHAGAIICFVLAIGFYLLAWVPGAYGLGFIGVLLEIAAWLQVSAGSKDGSDA